MSNHVIYDRIWESKKLALCSRNAALAYPWLYLVADDFGRFEFIPRSIWAKVFGNREDIKPGEVATWLTEYARHGLLDIYEVGDKRIGVWTKFVGPPPSKRRPSMLPDKKGVVDTEGLKGRSRFHAGTDSEGTENGFAPYKQEQEAGSRKQEGAAAPRPWVSEACDDWNDRYGPGSAPGGKLAGGLKGVVAGFARSLSVLEYDAWAGTVRPAWRRYLSETSHPSPNAQNFAEHFSDWTVPTAAAIGRPVAVPSAPALGKKTADMMRSDRMFLDVMEGKNGVGPQGVSRADEPTQGAAGPGRLRGTR